MYDGFQGGLIRSILNRVKDNKSDFNEKCLNYKEVFDELSIKRMDEICNMKEKIDFNKLSQYYKIPGLAPLNVIGFKGTLHIYSEIKHGEASSIEKIEKCQKQLKSKVSEIITENSKYRDKDQLDTLENIKNLYDSKENVIEL